MEHLDVYKTPSEEQETTSKPNPSNSSSDPVHYTELESISTPSNQPDNLEEIPKQTTSLSADYESPKTHFDEQPETDLASNEEDNTQGWGGVGSTEDVKDNALNESPQVSAKQSIDTDEDMFGGGSEDQEEELFDDNSDLNPFGTRSSRKDDVSDSLDSLEIDDKL